MKLNKDKKLGFSVNPTTHKLMRNWDAEIGEYEPFEIAAPYGTVFWGEIDGYGVVFTTTPEDKFRNVPINEGEVLYINGKPFDVKHGDVKLKKRIPRCWWIFSYSQLDVMLRNYKLGNCSITEKGLNRYSDICYREQFEDGTGKRSISSFGSARSLFIIGKIVVTGKPVPEFMEQDLMEIIKTKPEEIHKLLIGKR